MLVYFARIDFPEYRASSAGKKTKSAKRAADNVIIPMEAKMKWSRESLKRTVPKPETSTIVVMIKAVPTPVKAL